MSNAPTYRETFETRNKDFTLWHCEWGSNILGDSTISYPDYFTCVEVLVKAIQEEQLVLQEIPAVQCPNVVSSIMNWINTPDHKFIKERLEKYSPQPTRRGQVFTQEIPNIQQYQRWMEQLKIDSKLSDERLEKKLVTRHTLGL